MNSQSLALATIRSLHKAGAQLRVHGNGFIQLDVDANHRFHFWGHHAIPRQKVASPIHDHTFHMRSEVVFGSIVNINYVEKPGDNFQQFVALPRVGADTKLVLYGAGGTNIFPSKAELVLPDKSYEVPPLTFHETIARAPAVTFMAKVATIEGEKPRVLLPYGQQPDNEFDRNAFKQDDLWKIVVDILAVRGVKW